MLCDLNDIVSALAQYYAVQTVGNVNIPIRSIQRLRVDEPLELKPEILYVGTPADLRSLPVDQDLTEYPVLCVEEIRQETNHLMMPTSMRTLVYIYNQMVDEVLIRLSEITFGLGQTRNPMSVLYQRLLPCRTIPSILSCAAEEIGLPVMLVDDKHRITHVADTQKTAMAVARLQQACAFYPNIASLPGYDSARLEYDLNPERESFHISVLYFDQTYLFFFDILDRQGRLLGEVLIFNHEEQLPQRTMNNCLLLLQFVAMSVQNVNTQRETENVEDFLHAVFNSDLRDASAFTENMARFGWKLKPNLYVLAFSNGGQFPGISFRNSLQYYLSLLPGCHGFLHHGQVILLYDATSPLSSAEDPVFTRLRETLMANGLHCGISSGFHLLTELKQRHLQATQAVHFGTFMYPDACVHLYEDCIVYRLAELASTHEDLKSAIPDGLMRLIHWDNDYKTELVSTLEAYLLYRGNVAQCARLLSFHVNTIKYRISRIEEISGYSLSNGDDYFKLAFAMKLYRYLQKKERESHTAWNS